MENSRQQSPTWKEALLDQLFQRCLDARADLAKLEPRQLEAACLVTKGLTNAEIATHMQIKYATVENYLHEVNVRLGLRSRLELAVLVTRAALA